MSNLRQQLQQQLARFDDDAFAALANRGLLRRARKDLEKQAAEIVLEEAARLVVAFDGQRVSFDARGPAAAECSCPASGVCQHVLAAAITLAKPVPAGTAAESLPASPAGDEHEPLRRALLAFTARELGKHAGKAGYRWAWQFVQDLDAERDLVIAGDRNVAIGFRHPRISFRYMGGPLEGLLADADIRQLEKYRVAAVLAYQRAHGQEPEKPETPGGAQPALDLGKDHAAHESVPASLADSRRRLSGAVSQLARECVTLGLAHFSPGIEERFATLAVWAQGAQCHRLALLLRRIGDHVEMLLDRAGGADEHVLFDELTLAHALASALNSAASRGAAPSALLGRPRNEYEKTAQLELSGLGAWPWRSPSGYIGLTMLFWSAQDQSFLTCSDARPEAQRGFDPVARYKQAGPWSGFGGPVMASGRRIVLTGAMVSATGRISGSEKTSATVMPRDAKAFLAQLQPRARWSELARERAAARRSLLAEPQAATDWAVLRPAKFERAEFDSTRQALRWGLIDDDDARLLAELRFDAYTSPAIERLEQTDMATLTPGTLVVARLRGGATNFIAEPVSLVRPGARGDDAVIDALYFDPAPKAGIAARIMSRLRPRTEAAASALAVTASATPPLLLDLRRWLLRQAERGITWDSAAPAQAELGERRRRLGAAGFTAFQGACHVDPAEDLLRAHYLCMQYEHLLDDSEADAA